MKFAISIRTGKEVSAEYKLSRNDRYKCPCCDSKVILRAGYFRTPYFAHASNLTINQAKLNCEEYHPGNSFYIPSHLTKQTVSIADCKVELEKHDYFTTLCVEKSENDFNLYLSVPTISFDRENPISPKDLQQIKIRISAEGILIGQLPAIQLFTGGLKSRFSVKPTERDYELKVINSSGAETDLLYLESPIEGLSPKGNLFGKIDEEWIRIFPNSEVEWGGEFYYIAQSDTTVPQKCFPKEIAVKKGYVRDWKLWHIKLPLEPNESVESWLNKIDYFVVEARWKLQLLSVPQDYNAFANTFYFKQGETVFFNATSPLSKSETVLIVENENIIKEKPLKTNIENNCFFSVHGHFDKIYLEDFPETEISTIFLKDEDEELLNDKTLNLPYIKIRIKNHFFDSFREIDNERLNIIRTSEEFKMADIEINLKPNELNDFVKCKVGVYFFGTSIIIKNRLTFKEAKSEILDIIQKKELGVLTIDAGSLGTIHLSLENEIITKDFKPKQSSKISEWLSMIATSSINDHNYIGTNSNIRINTRCRKSYKNIVHSRSPFMVVQARALSKRKKNKS